MRQFNVLKILMILLLMYVPGTFYAQSDIQIRGIIVDERNEPIIGANVLVKGTTNGTITDLDGQYAITVKSSQDVLVFSYIGFTTQEILVDQKRTINVVMIEDSKILNEVVVIGYGSVKKKDLTGAISSLNGGDITNRKTSQLSQALQGAIPGLMVTRTSGEPGTSATVRVRGITSIGTSDPLVIVDGIPVNKLDDISPNDIESMTVLKDAASASIYGSRAAAGVILVTTKRAKKDQFAIQYNFEYGIETPTTLPDYLGPERYMEIYNEMQWNDGGNGANQTPTYLQSYIDNYRANNAKNPSIYPITDWTKLIMKNYAPRQSHLVTISGGSEKLKTVASIGYDDTEGLYQGRDWKRYTARINNDITLNKYLSFTLDANARRVENRDAAKNPMRFSRIAAPIYFAGWNDGTIGEGKSGTNDWGIMKEGGFKRGYNTMISGKAAINIIPIEGLKITGVVSPSFTFAQNKEFIKAVKWYDPIDPTKVGGYLSGAETTDLSEKRSEHKNIVSQAFANYTKELGGHSINLMVGAEQASYVWESLSASRDEFLLTEFPYLDLGPENYINNSGNAYEYAYRSYFGRAMYSYNNKYLLQFNLRRDASSKFDKKYRWGTFPSVSAGWVISEENFFKNVTAIPYLKLRASWGQLGNERLTDSDGNLLYYPYQSTINFCDALFYENGQIVSTQTAALSQYAIQNITWETTESYDIGIDVNFFNNRLCISADYYHKKTKDMLLPIQIPMYLGYQNPSQNAGKMHTNGWDLSINWNDKINNLRYWATLNLSDSRSIIDNLAGTQFIDAQVKLEGREFNEWYGYRSLGLYQTEAQLLGSAKTNNSVQVGDVWYEDISGPDGVPDGKISPEYDRVPLGGSLPRYSFGGTVGAEYKGIDLSVDFSGVGKRKVWLSPSMARPFTDNWGNVPAIIEGRYWSYYNTNDENLNARYPRVSSTSSENNYAMSDFWLFDGSYFRVKNITLGYTVPTNVLKKMKLQNLRIFASMNDCITFSHYPKGWDPEVGSESYPITTSYVFGISIKY